VSFPTKLKRSLKRSSAPNWLKRLDGTSRRMKVTTANIESARVK